MTIDKNKFIKSVTILCDTREQKNRHIIDALELFDINYKSVKLDIGDYSFEIDGKNFAQACIIERKASVNELWTNTTIERERFEKELATAHNNINSVNLLIEGCNSWADLHSYCVSDADMIKQNRKIKNIGQYVHNTLRAWSSANRYNFNVVFTKQDKSTAEILSIFYWYYYNYKTATAPRKLKKA